jgi:deazaflavin-dependent oxidoreductase (nitroreductase family)
MNDWNRQVIEEFRANAGKVGGNFEGATLLLLHTTGAKSGKAYVSPLVYLPDGENWVIFASKAGAPTNPDWFHNLLAEPNVSIEVGTETVPVKAVVVDEAERTVLYDRQVERFASFGDYTKKTTRVIPGVRLSRVAS